jgi:hypothetical protein
LLQTISLSSPTVAQARVWCGVWLGSAVKNDAVSTYC